ncbi:hypothetical protein GCM10027341_18680 [Spirosoma knui]
MGGSALDIPNDIVATPDGGYVAVGRAQSTDGNVTGNHGRADVWVVKVNSAGDLVWQKALGGSNGDDAYAVTTTSDGGFVIAGGTSSSDGDVTGDHSTTDYWIVKLNSTGGLVWQKTFGGSLNDVAQDIVSTPDGGFAVVGSSMSFDGDVTDNHGYIDFWVLKLNSAGNLIWQKALGGSGYDRAYAITATADGGLVVTGSSDSDDGQVTGNHGLDDLWVAKLNASGNLVWQKSLGGTHFEEGNSLVVTSDGGIVIAGYSASEDGDLLGKRWGADYWIVKLNSAGNLVWQKTYGGDDSDSAKDIKVTPDGGFVVIGTTNSSNGDITNPRGYFDLWVLKLNESGNLVWQKSLGGSQAELAAGIVPTSNGEYVAAGYTASNDGDVTENQGTIDYWIVKLGVSTPTITEFAASANSVCAGQTAQFTATLSNVTGSYTYTLTNGTNSVNGTASSNPFSQTLLASGAGSQSFSLTVSNNGQVAQASTNLTVDSHPDYQPLVDLYNSTNGAGWANKTGWLTNCNPCGWYGVTCSGGRVTRLDLPYNQLNGSLPSSLGSLTNLQTLALGNNQLSGSIPASLGSLANLQTLLLSTNQLSGSIPVSLGSLTNLQNLTLGDNQLSGSIPASLGNLTNLRILALQNNQLSGSIPVSLGNLTNLRNLALHNNQLSGSLPSSLGSLINIQFLYLYQNQLSGCYPPSLTTFCRVVNKDFSNNAGLPGEGSAAAFSLFCSTGQGGDAFVATATTSLSTAAVGSVVSLSTAGGSSYQWMTPIGAQLSSTTGAVVSATLTTTGVKTFTVVVSHGGTCSQPATVPVTVTAALPAISGFAASSGTVCSGNVVSFTATVGNVTGNYAYTLTNGTSSIDGTANGSPFSQTLVASGSESQIYTLTVAANNQISTAVTPLTVTTLALTGSVTDVSCNGGSNGSATVSVSGGTSGYRYSWSPTGGSQPSVANLRADTYTVTVTDANNCQATRQFTISEPEALTTSLASSGTITCANPTVTLTASPSGQDNYAFSGPGFSQSGASPTVSVTASGTYSVTLTNATGCTATATILVEQNTTAPQNVTLTNNGPLTCNKTSVTLSASPFGQSNYAFSGSGLNQSGSSPTVSVTASGTYSVAVTGANGCSSTATTTVSRPEPLEATASGVDVSCFGGSNGSATVNVSGGTAPYAYRWSSSESNQPTATGLTAGVYSVTVTDANSCTLTQQVTVSQPPLLQIGGSQQDVTCFGGTNGSATVTAMGGTPSYTYNWSSSGEKGNTVSGLSAGTYTVTVEDANGCQMNRQFTISEPEALTTSLASSGTITCANPTVTLTARPSGQSSYAFSGPGFSQSGTSPAVSVTASGTYSVTVTNATGCTATATTEVLSNTVVPQNVTLGNSGTLTCAQTSVSLTAGSSTENVTYSYSGPEAISATGPIVQISQPGTYTVTVMGANSCLSTAITTVESNTIAPNASLVSSGTITCANPTVTLAAQPLDQSNYTFFGPGLNQSGTNAITSVTEGGTYTVTVTGANGCSAATTATVERNTTAPQEVTLSNDGAITCAKRSAQLIAASSTTGSLSYSFAGSTPISQTGSAKATTTEPGTYTVTVTGDNGCSASAVTTVGINVNAATVDLTNSGPLSFTNTFVTLMATSSPNYSYVFSTGAAQQEGGNTAKVTTTGVYSVTVIRLDNGCTATASTTVLGGNNPTACRGATTVINVVVDGDPVKYEWYKNSLTSPKLMETPQLFRGTATSSLTLINAQSNTQGNFYLKVSDRSGTVKVYGPYRLAVDANCRAREAAEFEIPLQVELAPNPIQQDKLRAVVRGAEGRSLQVELVDLSGKPIRRQHWNQAEAVQLVEWDMQSQNSGVYLLQVVSEAGNGVQAQRQNLKVIKP